MATRISPVVSPADKQRQKAASKIKIKPANYQVNSDVVQGAGAEGDAHFHYFLKTGKLIAGL